MAVCKDQESEAIRQAVQCGIQLLGENRFQEAEVHMPALVDLDVEWHFIGKLQKNKINKIIQSFHLVESVDGVKNLEHFQKRVDQPIDVFIEINIGAEKSKSGFTVEGLRKAIDYISRLDKVNITGFLAVPPIMKDSEAVRPFFRSMRVLQREVVGMNIPNFQPRHLSMGMSQDFEIAVEEGATIIRIGTALFGRRKG